MKITILGSEGFVGNNLVNGLSGKHEISCADLVSESKHDNYTQFDITDLSSVDGIIKNADVVIDLVADSLVSSLDGSIQNARVNIIGMLNVLESCRKNSTSVFESNFLSISCNIVAEVVVLPSFFIYFII